ncbi:MAG: porin [Ramlibacter sp.]
MKHSFLALAACSLFAGAATAQSSVTLFGVVDIGIARETGGPAGSALKLDGSGIHSGNRLGFRGTEDLGGGLSALFVLENGFNSDTGAIGQGGLMFGRQALVGIKGGFGTVSAGRHYSPHFLAVDSMDPLDGISAGAFNLLRRTTRTDNTVMYTTPSLSGFSSQLAYGFGEVAGSSSASRFIGANAAYASGPLVVKAAYHNAKNATATDSTRNTYAGASYDFGPVKAILGYQVEKGVGTLDANATMLGVQIPMGASKFMATYIRKNDRTAANNDARMVGLAYTYALSKRTNFYASALHISNENTLVYRTKAGDGTGNKEFNFGIRHRF